MSWLWIVAALVIVGIAWELTHAPLIDLDNCPYGARQRRIAAGRAPRIRHV